MVLYLQTCIMDDTGEYCIVCVSAPGTPRTIEFDDTVLERVLLCETCQKSFGNLDWLKITGAEDPASVRG